MLDRGGLLVAQMVEEDVAELAACAPSQRIQDHFMLAHRFAPALAFAGKIGGVANPAYPPGEVGISRQQYSVAGGLDNFLMDELVDLEVAVHVAMQVEAVHFVMQALDFGNFLISDVFACQASGKTLQSAHDIKELAQLVLAQLPDARSPVGQQIDQSFRCQDFQSRASRRAGDPERGPQRTLGQAAAVWDVALHDVVPQSRENLGV